MATLIVGVLVWTLIVFLVGAGFGREEVLAEMPVCAEGEVLVPYTFKGPGKQKPSDYVCLHPDRIP